MKACPCSSGRAYSLCCGPLHRGVTLAPDAVTLMRSRYSAFAQKDVAYLWRTLHPDHPDRLRPEPEVLAELRASASSFRYTGLRILDSRARSPDAAEVLFWAGLYRQGKEHAFVEASDFGRVAGAWGYRAGVTRSARDLPGPTLETLTLERFRALVAA